MSRDDQPDLPDLRAAYRAAWADRRSTGDDSDTVLIRRLRLEGFESGYALEETVLAVWRRAVPPRRMVAMLVRDAFGTVVDTSKSILGKPVRLATFEPLLNAADLDAVLRRTRPPSADPPKDRTGFDVSARIAAGDWPAPWAVALIGPHQVARVLLEDDEWQLMQDPDAADPRIQLGLHCVASRGRICLRQVHVVELRYDDA